MDTNSKINIAVINSSSHFMRSMKMFLELNLNDYIKEVFCFTNVNNEEYLQQDNIDLYFIDFDFRDFDNKRIISKVLEFNKMAQVVCLSYMKEEEYLLVAIHEGAIGYIQKDTLTVDTVRHFIELAQDNRKIKKTENNPHQFTI